MTYPKYSKGRPKKGEVRKPKSIEYELKATVEEDPEETEKIRLEAGCFVLITNVSRPRQTNRSGRGSNFSDSTKNRMGLKKILDS